MSGHSSFRRAAATAEHVRIGESLLARGWAALESARAEAVDIHLRSGPVLRRVLELRIDGAVAEAATRPGLWTHAFAVEEVILVRQIPRGGG